MLALKCCRRWSNRNTTSARKIYLNPHCCCVDMRKPLICPGTTRCLHFTDEMTVELASSTHRELHQIYSEFLPVFSNMSLLLEHTLLSAPVNFHYIYRRRQILVQQFSKIIENLKYLWIGLKTVHLYVLSTKFTYRLSMRWVYLTL